MPSESGATGARGAEMAARSYLARIAQPVPAGQVTLTARQRPSFDDTAPPITIVADETTPSARPVAAARPPMERATPAPFVPPLASLPTLGETPAAPRPDGMPAPPVPHRGAGRP